MASTTSSTLAFNGVKLDINGGGLKQWITDIHNHITIRWGPDVTRFVRDKQLPTEHTQCVEQRYKINAGGHLITNKMPGMVGTFVEVDKKVGLSTVNCMTDQEKSKLKKIGGSYYGTVKKNIAVNYTPLYENDPYGNERVHVHADHVDMLNKFESEWVTKLAAVAADVVNWLSPTLRFRMENLTSFCNHRNNFRPEIMILSVIDMVVSSNAGDVFEKTQMSITILKLISELLGPNTKLGEDEDIDSYLNNYDERVQRIYILGCNNRDSPLPTGQDTFDYLLGVNLIRSVAGERFDDLIAKDDNEKLLRAPTCTYVWAKNRVKKWSDELQSSFKTVMSNGTKGKKRSINNDFNDGEAALKKATIMLETVFNHGKQLLKNSNKISEAPMSTGSGSSSNTNVGSISSAGTDKPRLNFDEWKKSKTCQHCQLMGHFANECPKASDTERSKYLEDHLESKRKRLERKQALRNK